VKPNTDSSSQHIWGAITVVSCCKLLYHYLLQAAFLSVAAPSLPHFLPHFLAHLLQAELEGYLGDMFGGGGQGAGGSSGTGASERDRVRTVLQELGRTAGEEGAGSS
jgi:hypothetical protein